MKNILLIGLGRFGLNAAKKLRELDHEVLAVDENEERVNDAMPYVTEARIGECTRAEFLKSLDVPRFDLCIVAIGDDFQSSLEITSLLKDFGAKKVVSRACNDVQGKFLLRNGADNIVYPERQLAHWTAIRYASDNLSDYIELGDDSGIFEVTPPAAWTGKTVGDIDIRKRFGVNILAIKKDGKMSLAVNCNSVIEDGIHLLVLGAFKDVRKCFKL